MSKCIQKKYISNRQVRSLKYFNSTNIEWQFVDLGRLDVISDSFVANLQLGTNRKLKCFKQNILLNVFTAC